MAAALRNSISSRASRATEDGHDHETQRRLSRRPSVASFASWSADDVKKDDKAVGSAELSFKDICFSVKVLDPDDPGGVKKMDKAILENCTGHISPGNLVAIMGPSGCGKSTLLDILAQKKTSKYSGFVYLNGQEVDSMFPRIMSYVPQFDPMPGHWKVGEAVAFNTTLRQEKRDDVGEHVDELLRQVALMHVKDSKIGNEEVRGISGGQHRRVSLARSLASKPVLMFCDEPTSGLSATDTEMVVKTLHSMTRSLNMTILVVIHQPRQEVADLFDHLICLTAQPGRIVYNGPMKDASAHWAKLGFPVPAGTNPTDHFLDTVTHGTPGADPEKFAEHYRDHMAPEMLSKVEKCLSKPGMTSAEIVIEQKKAAGHTHVVAPRSIYARGHWAQFCAISRRKLKLMLVDKKQFGIIFGLRIFMGIFYSVLFFDIASKEPEGQTQMVFFFLMIQEVAFGANRYIPLVFGERTIMQLENSESLYPIWVYLLAQGLMDGLINIFSVYLEVTPVFFFANMPTDKFPEFLMWLSILCVATDSLWFAVAAASKTVQMAQSAAIPIVLIFTMFGGFLVNRNSAPSFFAWIIEISPIHATLEMLSYTFYGDVPHVWSGDPVVTPPVLGLTTLFAFEVPSKLTAMLVMVAFCLFFRIVQVVASTQLNQLEK